MSVDNKPQLLRFWKGFWLVKERTECAQPCAALWQVEWSVQNAPGTESKQVKPHLNQRSQLQQTKRLQTDQKSGRNAVPLKRFVSTWFVTERVARENGTPCDVSNHLCLHGTRSWLSSLKHTIKRCPSIPARSKSEILDCESLSPRKTFARGCAGKWCLEKGRQKDKGIRRIPSQIVAICHVTEKKLPTAHKKWTYLINISPSLAAILA